MLVVEIANSSAQRLFRLRPGIALRDSGSPQLLEVFATVIASRKALHPKGFDAVIQVFDPEERFFLPHAPPILDSGGEPAGVTMVLADITELRRLDEMKSNLLAVVSHELKTPLTGLRMATHLLLDERTGALNDKQADLALAARDECARLNTIIEGLLDISRLQSGHALMEAVPMEPRVIVDRAVDALAAEFRDKGVSLDRQLPATLPQVLADPVARVDHAIGNLLRNALKFTKSGGQVSVSAREDGGGVAFRVEDSGVGIAAEHRSRIFERFYRVPGQTEAGAGLGLAIAKEVAHAHGRRIRLEDRPGAGSAFGLWLPA